MTPNAPYARDEPIDLERDAFGHADYVDTLQSIVTDEDAPSTVGVFGPWGVGKSTIVEALRTSLPDDVAYVYFDAWKYEEDSLRRQFLREVAGQLNEANALRGFDVEKELSELDVDTQTTTEGLKPSKPRLIRALIAAAIVGGAILGLSLLGDASEFLTTDNFGQKLAASVVGAIVVFLLALLTQVVVITETVMTRRTLQDPDRFANLFSAVLRAVKHKRLVVVVDNLDRCSPEKAVQLLSTIKTYLEPAVSPQSATGRAGGAADKETVFVIAVDDEALRRHLISQELERTRDAEAMERAERYVDEYLAKFFSARLVIREILPDDIREYVGAQLDPLLEARNYTDHRAQIVGLVSSALRHNPRRVKQFVNDLETRLRFLQRREASTDDFEPGIAPPISGEILEVAKLALHESEFPGAFTQLLERRRLLDEWNSDAEQNDEVWYFELRGDEPTEDERREAQRFASFLRASRTIDTPHLRALLRFKQAREEAALPAYGDFHEAVVNDDRGEVERVLDDLEDGAEPYALRIPEIVREEVGSGYLSQARAAVGAMIEVDRLREATDARRRTLALALSEPRLRPELSFLDPIAWVEAGEGLPDALRRQMCEPVVDRFTDDERTDDDRRAAGQALARATEDLSQGDRQRISKALADDATASKYGIYVELAKADPGLLPTGIGRRALGALSESSDAEAVPLLWDEEAFEVAAVAAEHEADADTAGLAIDLVIQSIDRSVNDPEAFQGVMTRALELLRPLSAAEPEQWGRLSDHLQTNWDNLPADHRLKALQLFEMVNPRAPEEQAVSVAANLAPTLFSDPGMGVELIAGLDGEISDAIGPPVVAQLTSNAQQHVAQREQATRLLYELEGDNAGGELASIVVSAIQQNQADTASPLLRDYEKAIKPHLPEAISQILSWLPSQGTSASLPPDVLKRLSREMSEEQREQLANLMVSGLQQDQPQVKSQLGEIAGVKVDEALFNAVLERAVEVVTNAPQADGPSQTLLGNIAGYVGNLSDEHQKRLADRLNIWLGQPQQRPQVADRIRNLDGIRGSAADLLVDQLLDLFDTEGDEETRFLLLAAADAVKGKSDSNRAKKVDAKLRTVERGSKEDKALHSRVIDARE